MSTQATTAHVRRGRGDALYRDGGRRRSRSGSRSGCSTRGGSGRRSRNFAGESVLERQAGDRWAARRTARRLTSTQSLAGSPCGGRRDARLLVRGHVGRGAMGRFQERESGACDPLSCFANFEEGQSRGGRAVKFVHATSSAAYRLHACTVVGRKDTEGKE